jgi:LCP family protein required for cell wall assembly
MPLSEPRSDRWVWWRRRVVITFGAVVALTCFAAATVVGFVAFRFGQIHRVDVALSAPEAPGGPQNFLVVGSDSRANISKNDPNAGAILNGPDLVRPGLSDSIMVMRVDPAAGNVSLLSIPRDLWVPIAGLGRSAKINSAFSAGPQTLVDTIQQSLGIPINHYVEVDFAGFQKLVDAIGGVPIYFDVAMRDTNSGVDVQTPGCVKLNGSDALAMARSRHLQYRNDKGRWVSDEANDFGRIARQQFLVRKSVGVVKHQNLLTDPVELNALSGVATSSVTLDNKLTIGDLVSLSRKFKDLDPATIESQTIPAVRYNPAPDGSDALSMQRSDAAPILAAFGGPPVPEALTITTPATTARGTTSHQTTTTTQAPPINAPGQLLGRIPSDSAPDGTTCS